MKIIKGYKVRIYPNKTQEQKLLKTIGGSRWVYNHFLDEKKKYYLEQRKSLSYGSTSKQLTVLRKQIDWLSAIQFQPLQQSLRDLDVSYNRFFRRQSKFPKFKSKKDIKQSFHKVTGWSIDGRKIHIMDDISIRFRGTFPKKRQGTLTVARDSDGSWYCSTLAEVDIKTPKRYTNPIGIDLGLNYLAITSNGEKYKNIPIISTRKENKELSRKKKGSKSREKARSLLSRKHKKITNIRKNYLHHISKAITSKNHALIAVEDLAVKNMQQNHYLARSISNASWSEFLLQLLYKQAWRAGKFVVIDRFFPSSKTCSRCHFIMTSLPLSIREWKCPRCETKHDRDVNAAKNILLQAGERLGAETGESNHGVRSMMRITRSMKL